MVPFLTDQSFGLPSQPVRSFPLNRLLNPGSAARSDVRGRVRRQVAARKPAKVVLVCIGVSVNLPTPMQSREFIGPILQVREKSARLPAGAPRSDCMTQSLPR